MPDFTLAPSTMALEAWVDASSPARDNPTTGHAPKRWRSTGGTDAVLCTKDGVAGPFDVNPVLGGVTFSWWWVEHPGQPDPGPTLVPSAGRSSVVQFACVLPGHYLLGCRREVGAASGPAVYLHFDYHP